MGLTKVTYAMIEGASINVLDYGADPTGTDDSTTAIQSAIDYVESLTTNRPNIYLPSGTYKITDALVITKPGVKLIGEGGGGYVAPLASFQGSTIINYTGSALAAIPAVAQTSVVKCGVITIGYYGMPSSETIRDCSIEGISIFANASGVGIYVGDYFNLGNTFTNVYIYDSTYGIFLHDHCWSNTISNCEIRRFSKAGIELYNNCHSTDIINCMIVPSTTSAIACENLFIVGRGGQSSNVTVSQCNFDASNVSNYVVRVMSQCKNFNFINNYVEIYAADVYGCMVVEAAIGNQITGNRFTGYAGMTIEQGIRLFANTEGTIISGNYFQSFASACIDVLAGATNYFISGNGIQDSSPFLIDNNAVNTTDITSNGPVCSGTYTPTLTNVTNLDGSTAYVCQYIRVCNVVTVSGRVDINPTAATTATELGMSLPIASNLGANTELGGVGSCVDSQQSAAIRADFANNRARFSFVSTADLSNNSWSFTFTYLII